MPSIGCHVRIGQEASASCEQPLASAQAFVLLGRLFIFVGVLLPLAGCGDEPLDYTEVKQIDEKVSEAELETFLAIVNSLPDKQLPELPPFFGPPPDWSSDRTLQVGELIKEEQTALDERWNVEWVARRLKRDRRLQRLVRSARMTMEQFIGLQLAIGVALSRTTLRDNQDLDALLRDGERAIAALRENTTSFSTLPLERKHMVLQEAVWVTRKDRAERLRRVPPENLALVEDHLETLQAIFPQEFTTNPLDAVADLKQEQGLPFEELPESGTDDGLRWSRSEEMRGTSTPDSEAGDNREPAQTSARPTAPSAH